MNCICEYCKKEFTVDYPSKKRRFCSKKCAQLNRWKNIPKKEKRMTCKICGKEFYIKACDHRLKEGKEIQYCSKKCAAVGALKGDYIKCKNCGKEFYSTRHIFCTAECAREYRKKHYQHKTYEENGYLCEYKQDYNKKGNVKQHRLIMENYLGRKLKDNEVVHHINGDKKDNRIENLQVMKRSEHSRYHRNKEISEGKSLFKSKEV